MSNELLDGYVGRFAPSPTGDLHFGSVLAAVASYLQARRNSGKWLVRIEDIDPPREVPGSAAEILAGIARLGMRPDEPVLFQSKRVHVYREKCAELLAKGLAFQCTCSRKTLHGASTYPGTCRNSIYLRNSPASIRIRVENCTVCFQDGRQGSVSENLHETCGDFVIWRTDDLPAYQLAVVVDDSFQNITEVVRGADLLDSTTRQLYLQSVLGLDSPVYTHIPVATVGGQKLSKHLYSDPVSQQNPVTLVTQALSFLGHSPPLITDLDKLWQWAKQNWNISRVPPVPSIELEQVSRIGA